MDTKAKEIKTFILSAIRQRKQLMREGKSHKNKMLMIHNIQHLERYLNAYEFNGLQMAKFFLQNRQRIESLLPGSGSKAFAAVTGRMHKTNNLCQSLINPSLWKQQEQKQKAHTSSL